MLLPASKTVVPPICNVELPAPTVTIPPMSVALVERYVPPWRFSVEGGSNSSSKPLAKTVRLASAVTVP